MQEVGLSLLDCSMHDDEKIDGLNVTFVYLGKSKGRPPQEQFPNDVDVVFLAGFQQWRHSILMESQATIMLRSYQAQTERC